MPTKKSTKKSTVKPTKLKKQVTEKADLKKSVFNKIAQFGAKVAKVAQAAQSGKASVQSKSKEKPIKSAVIEKSKVVTTSVAKSSKIVSKPAMMTKKGKIVDKPAAEPSDNGDILIKMAKEEMFKVNNPGVSEQDKVEKISKFKPIKVERGNLSDEKAKWQELFKRYGKEKASNYKMTESFESLKPVNHKILGWGFVLTNENDRLEVLFETGIKMLISNYKPN